MTSVGWSQRVSPPSSGHRQAALGFDQRLLARVTSAAQPSRARKRQRHSVGAAYASTEPVESPSDLSGNGSNGNGNGAVDLPSQGQSVQRGAQTAVLERDEQDSVKDGGPNVDYLQAGTPI